MNSIEIAAPTSPTAHRVEFFRLPAPGKRDPYFGLSRGWYYKTAALGEIKMIAIRQRNALRGVRLVVYDSVTAYIQRAANGQQGANETTPQKYDGRPILPASSSAETS